MSDQPDNIPPYSPLQENLLRVLAGRMGLSVPELERQIVLEALADLERSLGEVYAALKREGKVLPFRRGR